MKKFLLTFVLTIAVLIAGIFGFIISGAYNISQLSPHNKLTLSIIKITTHSSINKRLKGIEVPANLKDTSMIVAGFKHYNNMCAICHSAPGQQRSDISEGLYPKPPELYKFAEENDAREFFWITKNGIKMTSMPAFAPTHDDEKIWQITAFVTQKLGKMSAQEYLDWTRKYAEEDKNEELGKSK